MRILLLLLLASGLWACADNEFTPKPRGYFRIALPPKAYQPFDSLVPFTFQYPVYARLQPHPHSPQGEHWMNLHFNHMQAYVHLTYKHIDNDIATFLDDTYTLAYKHTIRAEAIREKVFANDSLRVYGLLYEIKGNAASSLQFFLTDSTEHFLRGALYFNVKPNKDSLAPVLAFIDQDIVQLIESLRWKNAPRR